MSPVRRTVLAARPRGGTFSLRLAAHQAWADRWLVLALTVLVAGSAAGAVALPRLLMSTVDDGAREAVAGAEAAVTAEQPVLPRAALPDGVPAVDGGLAQQNAVALAGAVRTLPALATVAGPPSAVVASPALPLTAGPGTRGAGPARLRLVYAWAADAGVRWVLGQPPPDPPPLTPGVPPPSRLDVGLARPVAAALGARVGSTLRITTRRDGRAGTVPLRVSGVFEPASAGAPVWHRVPDLLAPAGGDAAALVTGAGLATAVAALGGPAFTATYRLDAAPRLHAGDVPAVRAAVDVLRVRPDLVYPDAGAGTPRVDSPLAAPLADFAGRQRAVLALVSLVLTALVGVGALVVVLAAHLLVAHRAGDLALQHARGAARAEIAVRAGAEAAAVTLVGVGLGAAAASALTPAEPGGLLPLGLLAAVAVLAPPVLAVRAATAGGARPAAARAGRRSRAPRRLVVEGVLLALAVGGTVAVRGRGLPPTGAGGIDLLLAATPLLLAGAATAAVLRGYPWPLRGLRALAGRSRGAVGPVGVSRAATSWAAGPLPLLALTLAGTLAVCGGLLRAALVDGQSYAAWERVGADARVTAPAEPGAAAPAALTGLGAAPGVRHAAVGAVRPDTAFAAGDEYGVATLLLVDAPAYDAVLRDTSLPYRGELTGLTVRSGQSIPVLAGPELAARISSRPTRLTVNGTQYAAAVLGALSAAPAGWLPGDTLVADRAAVQAAVGAPVAGMTGTVAWATGPGAAAAATAAAGAIPGATAQTRAGWLAANTRSPLVAGTLRLLAGAGAAVAGYAGVALLLLVVATAAARNRTLAYLRTLGLAPGRGRLVAALELGPVVAAAALAGTVGGVGVPLLLRPALGLVALTGGVTDPPLAPRPATSLGLAAALVLALAGLLALALAVDGVANRRQRLDAVLRVGADR